MESTVINLDTVMQIRARIDIIDEQLDSVSGGESAGKRSVINSFVRENETEIDYLTADIEKFLGSEASVQQRIGVYFGILKKLTSTFDSTFDEAAKAFVVKAEVPTAVLSDDVIKTLSEQRKKLVVAHNSLLSILDSSGVDVSSVESIRKRTGSRGKRGPRVLSGATYQFYYNSVALSVQDNSLSTIAKNSGLTVVTKADNGTITTRPWKAADVRDFLVKNVGDFDPKSPPTSWSVTLPNGVSFAASKLVATDEDDDDDDDDENTDESGD